MYRASWSGAPVALKRMHDERKIALFKTEFDIMKNLRHPNIVQVFGFVQEGANGMSIVMEYLPNGSIENYITAANPGKPPREDLRHMWCIQMAQALGYLHNLEPNLIIHRVRQAILFASPLLTRCVSSSVLIFLVLLRCAGREAWELFAQRVPRY